MMPNLKTQIGCFWFDFDSSAFPLCGASALTHGFSLSGTPSYFGKASPSELAGESAFASVVVV